MKGGIDVPETKEDGEEHAETKKTVQGDSRHHGPWYVHRRVLNFFRHLLGGGGTSVRALKLEKRCSMMGFATHMNDAVAAFDL